MSCGIYEIFNKINDKVYVGSAKDTFERKAEHFRLLRRGIHGNQHLQRSFNKYGEDAFGFRVIRECEEADLLKYEKMEIGYYFQHELYNIILDPERPTIAEETRSKIREAKRNISDETRRKIGLSSKGRNHTEETRKRIGAAHSGKVVSEETRLKLSRASSGKAHTEETRQKMREGHARRRSKKIRP